MALRDAPVSGLCCGRSLRGAASWQTPGSLAAGPLDLRTFARFDMIGEAGSPIRINVNDKTAGAERRGYKFHQCARCGRDNGQPDSFRRSLRLYEHFRTAIDDARRKRAWRRARDGIDMVECEAKQEDDDDAQEPRSDRVFAVDAHGLTRSKTCQSLVELRHFPNPDHAARAGCDHVAAVGRNGH